METPQRNIKNQPINDKLFKTLGYDLRDPRSPNIYFNRTPIQIFTKKQELSETHPSVEFTEIAPDADFSFESALSSMCDEITTSLSKTNIIDSSPNMKLIETTFDANGIETLEHDDPRSPSIGIERTPIVFGKSTNLVHMENISKPTIDDQIDEIFKEVTEEIKQYTSKNHQNNDKMTVYEEVEDVKYSTPKKQQHIDSVNRTPLSCLENKTTGNKTSKHSEIRKLLTNSIKKSTQDENTPEMGMQYQNIVQQKSISGSIKTRIPIRRGLQPRN